MLNIFEFSWVWENIESWLVYANKVFKIAEPYFSTDIIKQSASSFFLLLRLLIKKSFLQSVAVSTVIICLYFNETKKN